MKEKEQFPKVMTKEDTKELLSIIESLNSKLSPEDKIGFNLQYRQVKIPNNVLQELKKRKAESVKAIDKEKMDEVLFLYEKNKSEDEQIKRAKLIEIENLDKTLKRLNTEEAELIRENENIKFNKNNLQQRTNDMKNLINRRKKEYDKKVEELEKMKELSKELDSIHQEKSKINKDWEEFEIYIKKREKIQKAENDLKSKLCILCFEQIRMIYYSFCGHLSLCKKCYSKTNKYEKKCPICFEKSELVVKILDEKKGY